MFRATIARANYPGILILTLVLASCGGGGGGSTSPSIPPIVDENPEGLNIGSTSDAALYSG
jgi:hypothetical protein